MVLFYQVLTRQCLKKVFLTSNDFVSNDSGLAAKYYYYISVSAFCEHIGFNFRPIVLFCNYLVITINRYVYHGGKKVSSFGVYAFTGSRVSNMTFTREYFLSSVV